MLYLVIIGLLLLIALIALWLSPLSRRIQHVRHQEAFLPAQLQSALPIISTALDARFQLLIRPDPRLFHGHPMGGGPSPDCLVLEVESGRPLGMIIVETEPDDQDRLARLGLPMIRFWPGSDPAPLQQTVEMWLNSRDAGAGEARVIEEPDEADLPEPTLEPKPTPPVQDPHAAAKPTRTCPKCGKGMQRKKVVKGRHAGRRFWVCTDYPDCQTAVPITDEPESV
uniref:DNA topoisomerase type IA zn finger domain-containing protein n=1 Tax=Magnetococcus massalia (strain MO-1) TaxID=451514 RepID=A0A1S7LLM9_MAGMO|nr:Conserved protein of unknown function. Containing DNA topoisomerase, type IA, Zn finger domain [Candidatus Magnetococcus massalia]